MVGDGGARWYRPVNYNIEVVMVPIVPYQASSITAIGGGGGATRTTITNQPRVTVVPVVVVPVVSSMVMWVKRYGDGRSRF